MLATTGTFSVSGQARVAAEEGMDLMTSQALNSLLDACTNLEYHAGLIKTHWRNEADADRLSAVAKRIAEDAKKVAESDQPPDARCIALQDMLITVTDDLEESRKLMVLAPAAQAGGSSGAVGLPQEVLDAAGEMAAAAGVLYVHSCRE